MTDVPEMVERVPWYAPMVERTPEVVRRVATALCKKDGADPEQIGFHQDLQLLRYGKLFALPSEVNLVPMWMFYVEEARAAIEAMREPDKQMVEAIEVGQDGKKLEAVVCNWYRMIDAALGKEPMP